MEGNFRSDTLPLTASLGCASELNLSNSEVSSLTAENCKDIFRRLVNVTPDDCTAWTDEKHNLYLNHLEVSFITQLHKSRDLAAQCSVQNLRYKNIHQKRSRNASEKYGYWQKINHVSGERLSCPTTDSINPLKKCMGMHTLLPSVDTQSNQKLHISGLATCSKQLAASSMYNCDLFNLMEEDMGQNFVDEDNHKSNIEHQAKRLKIADGSSHEQVVPLMKLCATDK